MSHFLLTSTPIYGHIMPMLAIGRGLLARGHSVSVLTGRKYADSVMSCGLRFLPLPSHVDYDDAHLDRWLPDRHKRSGIAAGRYDVLGLFVHPLRAQHHAVSRALAADLYDGIVCETSFLGVMPLLLGVPSSQRLPIVGVSATPMTLTSVDCAPFGSGLDPGDSPFSRLRNRQINFLLHRGPLRAVHSRLEAALVELGVPRVRTNFFDQATKFDVTFQLAVAGIEYPRREMPESVRFVGPLRTPTPTSARLPDWWADLSGPRPVVHVTQGTLDNTDPAKLLVPTLRGLAGENVLVVASTGGRPVETLTDAFGGPLPENARVAEFIPYDRLLPQTDLVVTNGGYGGVQRALSHGLPLVVAGSTEDKPEVAARVAWSGSGLNLRTGKPSPARLRTAVLTALREPRYRLAAQRLQSEIATLGDPLATIVHTLERLTADSAAVGTTPAHGGDFRGVACDRSNLGTH